MEKGGGVALHFTKQIHTEIIDFKQFVQNCKDWKENTHTKEHKYT